MRDVISHEVSMRFVNVYQNGILNEIAYMVQSQGYVYGKFVVHKLKNVYVWIERNLACLV